MKEKAYIFYSWWLPRNNTKLFYFFLSPLGVSYALESRVSWLHFVFSCLVETLLYWYIVAISCHSSMARNLQNRYIDRVVQTFTPFFVPFYIHSWIVSAKIGIKGIEQKSDCINKAWLAFAKKNWFLYTLPTLECGIVVQVGINVQVGILLQKNKRTGLNKHTGGNLETIIWCT